MTPGIEVSLLARPDRLSMAELDRFRLGIAATNTTAGALVPDLPAARLLVNGERSTGFDLAIGNGVVPRGWDVLAGGETAPLVEYALGTALFPRPGTYRLELLVGDAVSPDAAQTVVVVA